MTVSTQLRDETIRAANYTVTDVYRSVPTPIVAVAAHADGAEHAMIVSSFTAISDDPALVSVSIKHGSTTWPRLRTASEVGISVLTTDHNDLLARAWKNQSHERLAGYPCASEGSAIHLADSPTRLTCDIADEVPVGDHTLVILAVCSIHHDPRLGLPIVHHNRTVTELLGRAE